MLTAQFPTPHRGRRLLAGLALALAASLSWALPTPKDISAAVNAGEYHQAETMLREVIKEKPTSAKAQYELGEVLAREGRNLEAREALKEAEHLDPTLKFASDPQRFRDLLNKIPATDTPSASRPAQTGAGNGNAAGSVSPPAVIERAPAASHASFPWVTLLIAAAALVLVWRLASRLLTPPPPAPVMPAGGPSFNPNPGYGQPPYGQPYGAPPAAGGLGGVGGAVLGGIAGVAAGYGLAKAFEHDEDRPIEHRGNSYGDAGGGFTPIDNPPDYGSFDAGSGASDSWDSGGGGGSDDNNW
ncbi:MAG: tetratricopeptide repeat protein [Curvibacter sp.]|nr:tetratricopeptide repeat protein [Curvibacter sp.]